MRGLLEYLHNGLYNQIKNIATQWNGASREQFYQRFNKVKPKMFTVLIEAKNYNVMISSGRRSLINIVVKQFEDRLKHLPEGSHQTVVIDVRGPDETGEILKQIREEINQRTFGQAEIIIKKIKKVGYITELARMHKL
ncbi:MULTISPECIES: hypothetical protein [Bacillus cereus group]|uniref:hypothetical protein n=1 Tax=Bacillus cereus group TaxID=86661 RepID=UPI00059E5DE9|nr:MULTISPECIES: hypothetical protein [Bacillus cereus group]